jgi:hypothetical protein
MAIINDALWSEVFITYEDGDTKQLNLLMRLKLKNTYLTTSLNLGLDMWTYKNGECKINKFLTFKNRWVEIFLIFV